MHLFLKSIGFGKIQTRNQIKELLAEVEHGFTRHQVISTEENVEFCEFYKPYGEQIGISLVGFQEENKEFEREYYFPQFRGKGITSDSDIIVERRIEKDIYVGICEDVKIGVSLIFHLQNAIEYMKEKHLGNLPKPGTSVTLSGLALSGTVLFPIKKDFAYEKAKKEESRNRMMLLSAAKSGDQQAMESLTLDDIDTYSKVSKRLITEDVFSIVETYFMPYGVECDQYAIMGEILEIETIVNTETDVVLYCMTLDVNELQFDVCVPKAAVTGEPKVGRRFKTNIWLQGYINF